MTEKKKMGRPPTGKGWKSFSLDEEVIEYLNTLPPGARSRFANYHLARGIAEVKVEIQRQQDLIDSLKGENHESN